MKKVFLFIIISCFTILNVKAVSLKPTGSTSAVAGSDLDIYLTLTRTNEEKQISAVDGILNYDTNVLTLKSANILLDGWSSIWPLSANGIFSYGNNNFSNLISDTNKNILKITFSVNENASGTTTISTSNTTGTDDVPNEVSVTGGSLTINITKSIGGNTTNTTNNTTTNTTNNTISGNTINQTTNNTATNNTTNNSNSSNNGNINFVGGGTNNISNSAANTTTNNSNVATNVDNTKTTNTANTNTEKSNPETGYFIPTILIIGGLLIGSISFYLTRKKHKLINL